MLNFSHLTFKYVIILGYIPSFILANKYLNPIISSWLKSSGKNSKGFFPNVLKVQYSNDFVYITCQSIPEHSMGYWIEPAKQNFTFKFPLNPIKGQNASLPLGPLGVLINGVIINYPNDGTILNDYLRRNSLNKYDIFFDTCRGMGLKNGYYHTFTNPKCMYKYSDSSVHSPIIGFAFDGYPIYGPFSYNNATDPTSGIKRLSSSYKLKNITQRIYNSSSGSFNTPVSSDCCLGKYIEDYEYLEGLGDLDEYNGRFSITPEYPNGTYAYFVTSNSNNNDVYPYLLGQNYFYGDPITSNYEFEIGKNYPSESVVTYFEYQNSSSRSFLTTNLFFVGFNLIALFM